MVLHSMPSFGFVSFLWMTFLQHLAVTKPQSGISLWPKARGGGGEELPSNPGFLAVLLSVVCKSSKELLAPIKPQSVFRDTVSTLKLVDLDPAKQNGCSYLTMLLVL